MHVPTCMTIHTPVSARLRPNDPLAWDKHSSGCLETGFSWKRASIEWVIMQARRHFVWQNLHFSWIGNLKNPPQKTSRKKSRSGNNNIRSTAKLIRVDLSSIGTLLCFISSLPKRASGITTTLIPLTSCSPCCVKRSLKKIETELALRAITLHTCQLKRSTY